MPYQDSNGFERSGYQPLKRLLESKEIESLWKNIIINIPENSGDIKNLNTISKDSLEENFFIPDIAIAIDGSKKEHPLANGFPNAEIGYVTIASVIIQLSKIRELEKQEFINPVQLRKTEDAATDEYAYPGCNVILRGEESAVTSLRRVLFDRMKNKAPFYLQEEPNKETLLDTFEVLLKHKGNSSADCPIEGCDKKLLFGYGEYQCSCADSKILFSTDNMRLHELHKPNDTCGEMYGQIMFTLERIWLIHILRGFLKTNCIETLKKTVFIIDGSLSVNSSSSWLAMAIKKELAEINRIQKEKNKQDLMIIGIEKTGTFVNHFEALDTKLEGAKGIIPNQTAILLDNDYVKKNIVFNNRKGYIYGEQTYFGRKFFYKTKNGYKIVATLATYTTNQSDTETAYPNQFPRLADVMNLLDQIVSSRFQNSVYPISSAHAEASIPLNFGKAIFEKIAREIRQNQ